MALAGLMQTSRAALAEEWPFYRMQVVAVLVIGLLIAGHLTVNVLLGRAALPKWNMARWVVGRAVCTAGASLLSLVAVRLGAPIGDVASLGSVNTVAAALLGRLFLGEALERAHVVGLACSIAGATLIGVSGLERLDGRAFLGYPLAVLAGFAQALQFVFARKSRGVPAQLLSVVGSFVLSSMSAVLVATNMVEDYTFESASEAPWQAVQWLATLGALLLISTSSTSTGGQMCPAAVSATLSTGAGMVSGYAVQALFFAAPVGWLSLLGASLMLASMLFMASSRVRPVATEQPEQSEPEPSFELASQEALDDGTDTISSFASFMSAEFAAVAPTAATSRWPAAALQRRSQRPPNAPPVAKTLGAATLGGVTAAHA